MNLLQIRTKTRLLLDDNSEEFWTNDELDGYINDAYEYYWEMLVDNHHSTAKAQDPFLISLVSGQSAYDLPADYLEMSLCERVFSDRSVPIMFNDRKVRTNYFNQGVADFSFLPSYRFVGGKIKFEPTPTTSLANAIQVEYYKMPVLLDDDDGIPEIKRIYHKMLSYKAATVAKAKEESKGGSGADTNGFEYELQKLERSFSDNIESETDQPIYTKPFGIG